MTRSLTLMVLSLIVIGFHAPADAVTWMADFQSNPTIDPGGGDGFFRERNFSDGAAGGPHNVAWDATTFAGFQTTTFVGSDSPLDGAADAGLKFPGGFGLVLDTQPDSNFDNNLSIEWGAQRDSDGDAFFGFLPVAKRANVVEFRSGAFTDHAAGLLNINIGDDGAGGQQVTVTPVNFGGQGAPVDLEHAWTNQNALIDLENKDGDGKTIEFDTSNLSGTTWVADADRDAGLVLASGLSSDIVEIDIDVDVFNTLTANEVADFVTQNGGLEEAELNYMLASYSINDADGVSDAITGTFGIAVTHWLDTNPAPFGTGFSGGTWDYINLTLADDNGTLVAPSNVMLQPFTPVAVPEPSSIAIWSLIGLGLAVFGNRRTKKGSGTFPLTSPAASLS